MINKVEVGIPGLDEVLKGGVREGASVLITGPPGTGKTILGIQFIVEGAKKGEAGIYITSEETIDDLRLYAEALGLDMKKFEKEGLITLIQQSILPKKLMSIATPLTIIKSKKIKRVVLDSITLFEYMHVSGEMDYRKEVLDFVLKMKESNVTLLTIAEKSIANINDIEYKPEDFLFEGLIVMTKIRKAQSFEHCLYVAKMRGQDHLKTIVPFKIGAKGIEVYPKQLPFSLMEKGKGFK
jgi:KaiC/GvpD/RAD55 family RecA-like ATPase